MVKEGKGRAILVHVSDDSKTDHNLNSNPRPTKQGYLLVPARDPNPNREPKTNTTSQPYP